MLKEIFLSNLLSFGPAGMRLELRPLNVLIGPNGSGKSNLINAVSLLQAAPHDVAAPVLEGGGVAEWLFKGVTGTGAADLEVLLTDGLDLLPGFGLRSPEDYRYRISFTHFFGLFNIAIECVSNVKKPSLTYFLNSNGIASLLTDGTLRQLLPNEFQQNLSILSQRKDPIQYLVLTTLANNFERVRIFREWSIGRMTQPRLPQRADQRNDFLAEDCSNLGMVLSQLRQNPNAMSKFLEALRQLYADIVDFNVLVQAGTVQVFLQEGTMNIPATRLSDGTLRYLCLLAILCHPNPPPLVCIEEPELGLHPDVIVSLGELLKEASSRMQLIVTTHSDVLVDSLSSSPEDVIVCEKVEGASTMRRLESAALTEWLKKYSLAQLWRRGEIGGNRW